MVLMLNWKPWSLKSCKLQQYQQCIEFSHVLLSLKQLLPLHLNQSQAFKIHQIAFSVYTNRQHWCQTLKLYIYGQMQQLPTITDRLGTIWENPWMHVNTDIDTKGCSRVPQSIPDNQSKMFLNQQINNILVFFH